MSSFVVVLVAASSMAAAAACCWLLILPRLPEPAGDDDALSGKIPYPELVTPGKTLAVIVLAAVAAMLSWVAVPVQIRPFWVVLGVLGVVLAAIDGYTTWIPALLTRWGWAAMAAAAAAGWLLGAPWTDLVRAVGGAFLAGGLYLVLWVATKGGFGFGDVRFVPLIAAPCAALGWSPLVVALLAGSALGIAHALWRRARHLAGVQPWGPALITGAYLTLIMGQLVGA